jgi:hypothetical protein
MTYEKPTTLDSIAFEEESLPSGRKLLHLILKHKFGNSHYKWTPPWKGECGVEKLFFKALEIEEYNDPEGAWSKELKQASHEIPSLDEIRLPFKIIMGEIAEEREMQSGEKQYKNLYRIAVRILMDEEEKIEIRTVEEVHKIFIKIGEIKIAWESLKSFLLKKQIELISTEPKTIGEYYYNDLIAEGIQFNIWLPMGLSKIQYQSVSREIASGIRAFTRKYFSDYKALKRGFEES